MRQSGQKDGANTKIAPIVIGLNGAKSFNRANENMTKKLPDTIDDELLRQTKDAGTGIGIDALYRLLGGEVSRRSLQRRLSQFVAAGLLMTKGGGRSTRYLLRPTVEVKIEEDSFAFSPSGIAVRQSVRRPLRNELP